MPSINKVISLKNQKIEYILKVNKKSKTIRLAVYPGGQITVTVPYGMPPIFVERFLKSKDDWILDKFNKLKNLKRTSLKGNKKEYLQHKKDAEKLVKERLEYFNKFYGFKYKKISIRNQKGRWGSCSKLGNLNFNYKLALIPGDLSDYVIVHELCHLKELNHSKSFWNLVSKTFPNYKELRKKLVKEGRNLTD